MKALLGLVIIIILIIVLGIVVILYGIGTYNGFIKMRNKIDEAFATMDVYLKKRWDLVPNLVNTVKGYAEHEKSTLEMVTAMRKQSYDNMTQEEKIAANKDLSAGLGRLIATAEAYPDLKANDQFLQLSKQLNDIETDIAQSRKYFNACVREMNTKVDTFPSNIIAGLFHFKKRGMFEVDDDSERENVKIEF